MQLEKTIKFELAKIEDASNCNSFYNNYYGKNRSIDQWIWEFTGRIPRDQEIPFVKAIENNKIIGTQALIPIRFIDEDGIYCTAKSEETLVAAEARGKNLFNDMYRCLFDYCNKNDIYTIWGFTPAERAFRKAGFDVLTSTKQLVKVNAQKVFVTLALSNLNNVGNLKKLMVIGAGYILSLWSLFCSLLFNIDKTKNYIVKNIESSEYDFSKLCSNFVKTWGGATIYRDSNYLNWRIFNNPYMRANMLGAFKGEQLIGYVAYCIDENGVGYVVDLMVGNTEHDKAFDMLTTKYLLKEACRRLERLGAGVIRFWQLDIHAYDKVVAKNCSRLGFLMLNRGHPVVVYNVIKENGIIRPGKNTAWYITRIFTEGVNG